MATDEVIAKEDATDARAQAVRWHRELAAARKEVEKYHERGKRCWERFRDSRKSRESQEKRLNLYSANVQLQAAVLYGKTPRVDVSRRFADSNDDVARVASEMLERILNSDIEADADSFALAIQYALMDRLVPGLGACRVRYVADIREVDAEEETEPNSGSVAEEEAEEGPEAVEEPQEEKAFEDAVTDYVPWNEQLWSPARTFHEVRWWAFAAELSREDLVKRFGKVGELVPLNAKRRKDDSADGDGRKADPSARAVVWEVWSKEDKSVYWLVEGFPECLDVKPDPLELQGFWPFPRPMAANLTTESLVPTPDYALAQDIYEEINIVSSRISLLVKALKVAGVYDKTNDGVQRLMNEATENQLIPISGWAAFAEKGGIQGAIAWMPIDAIVAGLERLREHRAELIALCDQVTGMSDILRGAAAEASTTATEQRLKGGYGSVRLQSLQEEFARFASDLQRLKAEIIAKHFDADTIIERSNVLLTDDAPHAQEAVAFLKTRFAHLRIAVRPENVAMQDFARQKSERLEVVQALGQFLSAAAPLVQSMPTAMPAVLKLMKWAAGSIKGSQEAEGIFDAAVAQAEQAQQQPQPPAPPDPKMLAAQAKAQADLQKIQLEHQADMQRLQQEAITEEQKQKSQTLWNIREEAARAHIKASVPQPLGGLKR